MKTILLTVLFFLFWMAAAAQSAIKYDSLTDQRDGRVYKTILIGDQTWMAENLAYLPEASPPKMSSETEKHYHVYLYNGTSVSEARSTPNYRTYGVLYNWEAAKTACPAGWRLPSDGDWKVLEKYLGMSEEDLNKLIWRNSGRLPRLLRVPGRPA